MIDNFSTIRYTIQCYITTKQEGYCYGMVYFYHKCQLVSCLWAQKSVQLTSLVGCTHVLVVSTILNITLNKIAVHKD